MKDNKVIARFTKNSCGFDPTTGESLPRGTNVMYHRVFWGIPLNLAKEWASKHNANLVVC